MRMLATQAMSEAQYMSTGEAAFGDCQHYGNGIISYSALSHVLVQPIACLEN